MNKKGASHIEIILSFLIFVTAIGFALYFFSPSDSSRLVETSTDYIYREINKNTSLIVTVYSIKINNGSIIDDERSSGIGQRKDVLSIKFDDTNLQNMKTYVEMKNGSYLASQWFKEQGQEVFLQIKTYNNAVGWTLIDFIYVYFSDEFIEEKVSGSNLNDKKYYKIGSSYSENVISWNRTLALAQAYNKSYYDLKTQFNIPGRVNFGFLLAVSPTMNITAQRQIPQGLDVFTEERRVKVLKDNRIIFGNLIVKVW